SACHSLSLHASLPISGTDCQCFLPDHSTRVICHALIICRTQRHGRYDFDAPVDSSPNSSFEICSYDQWGGGFFLNGCCLPGNCEGITVNANKATWMQLQIVGGLC